MNPPTISILMPMKNTEPFLTECIESIIHQTFKDWELIVVDDHSTDNSFELLNQYVQQDSRIKILKNKGKGIIDALRLAYQYSTGQLITRMDADDIMTTDKLELMYKQLKTKGKGHLAVGLVEYFSETKLQNGYRKYAIWLNQLTNTASNFEDIYRECAIPSPCWMIHREDFEKCNGFKSNIYPEDYDLAFRFKAANLKIAPVRKVIHRWRDYNNRTSRTDDNYADNRFSELKVHHFIQQDRQTNLPLMLWGAGRKGKKIAQLLKAKNETFQWICNNPKKIGKEIYGTYLTDLSKLTENKKQVIVAVSSPNDAFEIKNLMIQQAQHQYFKFC